jgi:hypothetical protein
MAIGELTRQLAAQALGDALRPAEQAGGSEAGPADLCATILGQVQAMQKALKEDQELVVFATAGAETVRVLEFFVPSRQVLVFTGLDAEKNITRVISAVESVQLVCKVLKVPASAKPNRLRFVSPKP